MSRSQKMKTTGKIVHMTLDQHFLFVFCLVKKTNTCTLSKQREILQLFHANQLHKNDSASLASQAFLSGHVQTPKKCKLSSDRNPWLT